MTNPTEPRAYGVVTSAASEASGLIATYAPTFGAALDAAAVIRREAHLVTTIVRKRPADHPTHPGEYTDAKGRTPAQIAQAWAAWAEGRTEVHP